MAYNINNYYDELFNSMFSKSAKIAVGNNFHAQTKNINFLLKNDITSMISTIYDFMVQSATVPVVFETKNNTLNNIFTQWTEGINTNINIDIPRGFRSFSEQYFRERWSSSFILLNIRWGKIDGYDMPINMWFSDGSGIYVEHENDDLRTTKYFLNKSRTNELVKTSTMSYIVRKPYNHWYDKYPTPYFVKKGALYHAMFKQKILDKQAQGIEQVFPAMLAIKMGCDEAMRRGEMPKQTDLDSMKEKFINLRHETADRTVDNGLVGAFPYDVNFENLLPEFKKVLDESILGGVDRNLLMSLGLIEFKGFSTNREESILNPKPLMSEIEDAVDDFVELISDVVYEIRQRNEKTSRKFSSKDVTVSHSPIKNLLTDAMKSLIRSLYDRGLISKEDTIEGTTSFDFSQQVEKRKREHSDNLDEIMKAPVILNQDSKDTVNNKENVDPNLEKSPSKKKSEKDVKAKLEGLDEEQKDVFINAYADCLAICVEIKVDEDLALVSSFEFAEKALDVYIKSHCS